MLLLEHQAARIVLSLTTGKGKCRRFCVQAEEQPSDELCGRLDTLAADSVFSSSREPHLLLLKAQAHRALSRQQRDPQQASGHLTEACRSLQLVVKQGAGPDSGPAAAAAAIAEGCKQLAGLCSDLMQVGSDVHCMVPAVAHMLHGASCGSYVAWCQLWHSLRCSATH